MRLYGLIGFPLTHSFSKRYFSEKFAREGITDCRYELFPLREIEELPGLIDAHPGLRGLNVTVPHKKSVIQYLHSTGGIPSGLRACNCIRVREGRLVGYNTDWIGFEKSFTPLLGPEHRNVLVLGQGGAAEAVIFVLEKLGLRYSVVSRVLHGRAQFRYEDLDAGVIETHEVIINTTPVGMYPDAESAPAIPYEAITPRHLLFDLVYNPAQTIFLKKGAGQGAATANGELMLVIQAEESWKIWEGE
ncbi:MAG TPA: shikimate dehydrogenase [Chitinophagaceae bacterium]|nr:shikimate dehydrogenase [Chitinophagaceae bacterium]